ncbi:MAG: hypothetical protein IGQ45_09740 [Cyanobacterium sp. T60_A2020_053]|nr:hypothetical protein [Cyanobacterium sp. T60_A2020_053]
MYSLYRFFTNTKYKIKVIATDFYKLKNNRDLQEVTFLIPVRIDHPDREKNINLSIDFLQHHFDTNIIVGEESHYPQLQYLEKKVRYYHYQTSSIYTHKTKILNKLARLAETPIIVIWDTDALVEPSQILTACQVIKEGKLDMVYPYGGIFTDLPRAFHEDLIKQEYELSKLLSSMFQFHQGDSVGGAVFFNREVFFKGGMMNENFVSYGWEDNELIERFCKLDYKIGRIKGALVHLQHYRGENSTEKNLFAINNQQELKKIKMMTKEELIAYVEECLKNR